ncbi:hypothetical protein A6A04_09010 [Paramagnetospirillum marisnigri]|uniref:Uncharacterized protein n=1 Tax=Paramagnetospirillum marisnigri TaxID=1285242 RepID=A0A178M5J0_9PROT|nr:hypothetical protein A6A04_09010 [Paramagnetospirillum marisnigri]
MQHGFYFSSAMFGDLGAAYGAQPYRAAGFQPEEPGAPLPRHNGKLAAQDMTAAPGHTVQHVTGGPVQAKD